MINVLALADLYKEPIDGLSVDHVLQEITHKDMCHAVGCVRSVCVCVRRGAGGCRRHKWFSYLPVTGLRRWDKERLGILHYEKLTGLTLQQAQQRKHLTVASFCSNAPSRLSGNPEGRRPWTHLVLTRGSNNVRPRHVATMWPHQVTVHLSVCNFCALSFKSKITPTQFEIFKKADAPLYSPPIFTQSPSPRGRVHLVDALFERGSSDGGDIIFYQPVPKLWALTPFKYLFGDNLL